MEQGYPKGIIASLIWRLFQRSDKMKALWIIVLMVPLVSKGYQIDSLALEQDQYLQDNIEFPNEWFYMPCGGETRIGCFGVRYQPSTDPIGYFTYLKEVGFGEVAADFSVNDFHVLTFKVRMPITRHKK